MPIDSSKFRSNTLTGAVKVSNGYANIALPTAFYALEGNVSFNILVRTGSVEGPVIYTSPVVTLRDNSSFVSLTANTATVNEGDLVAFTLVTANALGNSTLYYSVLPATANVTSSDFVANTGLFYLTNNAGTFALKANADLSLMNETGENFRVQLRTGGATGNVVYATSNIAIQDTSNAYNIISLAPGSSTTLESSNITFTFTATNVPFGTVFYYETTGNATVTANTGSFVLNSISNTFTISAGAVPANETRAFNVNIRTGSAAGPIVYSSSTAYVVDSALAYMFATGGNEVYNHSGYRIHRFHSANTLTITRAGSGGAFSTIEYMVIGGGGSGGAVIQSPPLAGGGGGAGGMAYGNISVTSQPITVVVGSGGAADPGFTGQPGSNSYITSPDIAGQIIGLGGGKGGWAGEGAPGGSGGGGAQFFFSPTPGGSAIPFTVTGGTHYGNPGANGPPFASGGGGGAGGAGSAGSGGSGRTTTITGAATTWAAGGGAPAGPSGTINTGNGGGGGPQPSGVPGGGSGIVVLRYPYVEPPTYTSLTPVLTPVAEGANIVFTLNTLNLSNNTLLYYTTIGNVITTDFVSGNSGSFRTTANTTTITLSSNTNIPINEERTFQLQVRSESLTDAVLLTSNVVTIRDVTLIPLSASGGTQSNVDGYRIHVFSTSSDITFSNPGQVEYLIVAGGGGGSAGVNAPDSPDPSAKGSGGGAGGLIGGVFASTQIAGGAPYSIVVGGGGAGGAGDHPFFNPSPFSAAKAGFRGSNTTALGFVAVGGGAAAISGVYGYGNPTGVSPQGGAGGSGGGGSTTQGTQPGRANYYGGDGITGQGNPGGGSAPFSSSYGSGYGGGAGTAGGGQYGGGSPPLGEGIYSNISGTNSYYASGGAVGPGPWTSPSSNPLSGATNTGSGGRGGNNNGGPAGVSQAGGSGGSGVVVIRYRSNVPAFVNITTPTNFTYDGSNVVFTLSTTDLSNNTLLYYYTVGNILSSHFVTGNIGSFRTTLNSTTITLPTNSTIPTNEERFFQLRVAGDPGTSITPLVTSNVFTVKDDALRPKATSIQYLVVAGGGGGGGQNGGGGGGAGGYLANSAYPITPATPYTITVGGGGTGAPGSIPPSYSNSPRGGSGGNSSIGAGVVSFGGGGGGTFYGAPLYEAGVPGGSGGAGRFSNEPVTSSQPKAGLAIGSPGWNVAGLQGYPAGRSSANPFGKAGGGGGAGQTGFDGAPPGGTGGKGGDGLQTSISGAATYYAGGGAGIGQDGGGAPGGLGGGGTWEFGGSSPRINGNVNTGGGGAGMGDTSPSLSGGAGGAGIVIIRYPDTFATATTTGSPNVIYANANIIYRFWQSGTITF